MDLGRKPATEPRDVSRAAASHIRGAYFGDRGAFFDDLTAGRSSTVRSYPIAVEKRGPVGVGQGAACINVVGAE